LGGLDYRVVDVPDSISKDSLFHLFGLFAKLDEIVDVLLKIFVKELLWIGHNIPEGSLKDWTGFMVLTLSS